jgi:hypothetical protein
MDGADETEVIAFSNENDQVDLDSPDGSGTGAIHPSEQDDSPEAIVRRENQVIRLLRVLTALFLLLAAAATVTFIYLYMSRNQKERFQSEYAALSSTLIASLHLDLRYNFWMAHTVSMAVSLAMAMGDSQSVTNFTMPNTLWSGVTQEARWAGDNIIVSWIPFLYTDDERMKFEKHLREINAEGEETTKNPPCYVCGDPSLVVEDESATAELAGLTFSCGDAYSSGLHGGIAEDLCPSAQLALAPVCPCKRSTEDANRTVADEAAKNITWSPADGLYTYPVESADGTDPIRESFGRAPYAPMYSISTRGDENVPPLYNLFSDPVRSQALTAVMFNGKAAITKMRTREAAYYQYHESSMHELSSDLYYPVFDPHSRRVIGAVGLEFYWNGFLTGAVPAASDRVSLVIENTCDQAHTYSIDPIRNSLSLQGTTDLHDAKYDEMAKSTSY